MKKTYIKPCSEILEFEMEDIMTASSDELTTAPSQTGGIADHNNEVDGD